MPQGVLKSQLLSEIATLVGIGEKELLSLWGNADPTPRYGQSPRNSSAQRSNDTQKNFKNKPGASGFTPYKGNPLSPLTSYPHRIEGANSLSNNLLTPRRKPSSRADRSVQILFSDMKQWELLSNTHQSMLCSLSAPHGELFKWLDAQYLEIGVQSWAALLEGIKEHPHNDSLLQLFKNTPLDLETTPQELSSILIEMEKDAIDKELNQLIPTANSDPLAYERVRFLNNRRAKLKSGIAV
jgi:DNA primase